MSNDDVVLAPMVMGSELAFRMAVRKYDVKTCYTPMLRADKVLEAYRQFQSSDAISNKDEKLCVDGLHEDGLLFLFDSCPEDSPLVVQLCGNSPQLLYDASCAVHDYFQKVHGNQIRGIDLNLGCPQSCAKDGLFGAFLAENDPDLAIQCVRSMKDALTLINRNVAKEDNNDETNSTHGEKVALSCKIRLQDSTNDTIRFAQRLREAGCDKLTVHCRQRETKHNGLPDLEAGQALVKSLSIPVTINGGIISHTSDPTYDKNHILNETGASTIMIARAFLFNHRLMSMVKNPKHNEIGDLSSTYVPCPASLAAEYLEFAKRYPPPSPLFIRRHLRWIFRQELQPKQNRQNDVERDYDYSDWRSKLWNFLVRPYLEHMVQFEMVVVLYVHHKKDCDMPDSLKCYVGRSLPTFQSIRHYHQGDEKEEVHSSSADYDYNLATIDLFQ